MIICTRRIQFCAGHRVHLHESKCRNLHGHNYVAFFKATAPDLDSVGRIIDFSVLKERIGGWIDQHWDHGFLAFCRDEEALAALASVPQQKVYLMDANPTAENMAEYLLRVICPKVLAGTLVRVVSVVLWETENCHAEASLISG
jgi:6-pyruvoyltetrahydropterin/6-carboxytetrahydropterin synthase